MAEYYFLATAIPPIRIGEPLEISYAQYKTLLDANVNDKSDHEKIVVLRRLYDIENIRRLWKGLAIEPYGNFDSVELDNALVTGIGLPDYVYAYMEEYDDKAKRLQHFPKLLSLYFSTEIARSHGFLKKLLELERGWRLVLVGFRAKALGRDLLQELQYEDVNDDLIAQLVAQKDSRTFDAPIGYESLKPLFETHQEAPLELLRALFEYVYNSIEEMEGLDVFSINRLMGYMIQLILAEKWLKLDKREGLKLLDTIKGNS